MSGQVLSLAPGSRLVFDGEPVEVVAIDGVRVTLRNDRTRRFTAVQISRLAASARAAGGTLRPGDAGVSSGLVPGSLAGEQLGQLAGQAGHVREVLTGYKSGHPDQARPGEPRPAYRPGQPLKARYRAKAGELGITSRTVERWVAAYRESGEAGLAGAGAPRGRGTAVDPRWDEAVRLVLAEMVAGSTPTRSAVLRKAGARLDELHGAGVVPRPSAATAYRRLAELARGTNAVSGSATGRRSIADRPKGSYGRLRAMRPGEYAILDTQDLDVFAMEPVTCRWVRAQLTVAQDLFTRCITGLRVAPVSARAVDVAGCPVPRDRAAACAGGLAGGGVLGLSRGAAAAGVHRGGAAARGAGMPAGGPGDRSRQGVRVGARDQRVHPAGHLHPAGPAEKADG
jgi:transposase-like protein